MLDKALLSGGFMHQALSTQHQSILLAIARQSIACCVRTGQLCVEPREEKALNARLGCFVSIKKDGRLRGCIGNFQSQWPLYREVAEMACAAATKDPRFYPMEETDLDKFHVEISVLSPLQKIDDIQAIQVGTHGLYIEKGFHRGVLLPQVAVEYGWDRDTFLQQTCTKAGLPANAWDSENADIYIFSAQVFGDQP
jgi:hypothetical protein